MNKDGLIEMIEATITTNGGKAITKNALICALVAMVESM